MVEWVGSLWQCDNVNKMSLVHLFGTNLRYKEGKHDSALHSHHLTKAIQRVLRQGRVILKHTKEPREYKLLNEPLVSKA